LIPTASTAKAAHIRLRLGIIISTGNPLAVNFFLEKAELDAGVKPRATTRPSQPVVQSGQAITVDPMLPANGALLPFTTKPMPFLWCGLALRAIHVLLLLVHWQPSSFRNCLAEWRVNKTGTEQEKTEQTEVKTNVLILCFLCFLLFERDSRGRSDSPSKVPKINPNGPGCQQIQMVKTPPGGYLIRNIRMFGEHPGCAFGFYFPSVASQSPKRVRWSQELNM